MSLTAAAATPIFWSSLAPPTTSRSRTAPRPRSRRVRFSKTFMTPTSTLPRRGRNGGGWQRIARREASRGGGRTSQGASGLGARRGEPGGSQQSAYANPGADRSARKGRGVRGREEALGLAARRFKGVRGENRAGARRTAGASNRVGPPRRGDPAAATALSGRKGRHVRRGRR